jgi:hypothetical protein
LDKLSEESAMVHFNVPTKNLTGGIEETITPITIIGPRAEPGQRRALLDYANRSASPVYGELVKC